MILGCIDIGSNTTRLLVAKAAKEGGLRELASQRAFTRIGKSLHGRNLIPQEKIDETAGVVAAQARAARAAGAEEIVAVATAAIRTARNRAELVDAVERTGGLRLTVLSGEEEARLAFAGAARMDGARSEGALAVADVGGGSTELAIGDAAGEMDWCATFSIGSGQLADSYLTCDPPSTVELERVRDHVEGAFEGLSPPPADVAVAVGGTATSLRRLVGAELSHETLERGVRVLSTTPVDEVARRFELDPQRVRLLPAGILILAAITERLRLPLRIAKGGLREGVLLELAKGRRAL